MTNFSKWLSSAAAVADVEWYRSIQSLSDWFLGKWFSLIRDLESLELIAC